MSDTSVLKARADMVLPMANIINIARRCVMHESGTYVKFTQTDLFA